MIDYKVIYKIKEELNEPNILGINNLNLKLLQQYYNIDIVYRNLEFFALSDNDILLFRISETLDTIETLLSQGIKLSSRDIQYIFSCIDCDQKEDIIDLFSSKNVILTTVSSRQISPRTINQKKYLKSLKNNDITFGIGPAGTGKTFLAVCYAISLLKSNSIKKIVLVRPVVEAGERLGFLPGDLKDKIDPYLIPLYDALYDCLGKDKIDSMIDKGIIEVAPLAYMRGRTLESSIIILDEAQNSTNSQMKMFLTRLGMNSKMFITGDITQIDLQNPKMSGLIEAMNILKGIEGIKFIKFDKNDVMRHQLVNKIIQRYEGEIND